MTLELVIWNLWIPLEKEKVHYFKEDSILLFIYLLIFKLQLTFNTLVSGI